MPDFATKNFLQRYGSQFGEIDFDSSGVNTSLSNNLKMGANGVGPESSWKMNHKGTSRDGIKVASTSGILDKAKGLLGGLTGGMSGPGAGFAQRYNDDPEMQSAYLAMEGAKDTIAPMLGPVGMAGRAVEKMGKEFGTAVGGEKGGDIAAGILDPLSAQMEIMKNDDLSFGDKALGIAMPFLGTAGKGRNLTRLRVSKEANIKENAIERNTREDEYRQAEGLAALDSVQNLRKKQLGIIS